MATRRRLVSSACLLLCAANGGPARAADPDSGRFAELVRLMLLPEEQSLLKQLKDEKDRVEFQKIFWARRDPSPGTPANELESAVRATWARADQLFAMPRQRGAETGCGQALALLGPPDLVEGLDTQMRFNSLEAAREGPRRAETWTYRNRPDQPYSFTRGELRLAFDPECRFEEAGLLLQDLRRVAASKVVRPELGYERGADGHLRPLPPAAVEGPGGGAGVLELLASPREDFPLAAEAKLQMRGPKGEVFVAGLLRAAAAASATPVAFAVAARATDASGQPVASTSREVAARPDADGSLVAAWGLSLKPGPHQLTVAVLLEGGRGSTTAIDVLVPDLGGSLLATSPLVLYPDEPAAAAADARDPYAPMQMGAMRLRPRFGNRFSQRDALTVVATIHGAKPDAATGQAALRARYSILKDGRPVARGAPDAFATPDAVASVGPIPLADYAPGAYRVRLDVTDGVTQQTVRQEAAFEIRAAGGPE